MTKRVSYIIYIGVPCEKIVLKVNVLPGFFRSMPTAFLCPLSHPLCSLPVWNVTQGTRLFMCLPFTQSLDDMMGTVTHSEPQDHRGQGPWSPRAMGVWRNFLRGWRTFKKILSLECRQVSLDQRLLMQFLGIWHLCLDSCILACIKWNST